jgi:hypothetical protein
MQLTKYKYMPKPKTKEEVIDNVEKLKKLNIEKADVEEIVDYIQQLMTEDGVIFHACGSETDSYKMGWINACAWILTNVYKDHHTNVKGHIIDNEDNVIHAGYSK